ncbi:hypothetical protein SNK04_009461 [Fusarium graminearum]
MAVLKDAARKGDTAEAQFAHILDDASKLYSSSDSDSFKKLADFLNPPLHNVKDLVSQVEKQNGQFAQFREKRQSVFSALAACLDPVEQIGQIVSGAAQDTFAPAEGIFGAVAYLIGAARDVSSAYDTIVELFELLKVSEIRSISPRSPTPLVPTS